MVILIFYGLRWISKKLIVNLVICKISNIFLMFCKYVIMNYIIMYCGYLYYMVYGLNYFLFISKFVGGILILFCLGLYKLI